jgi:anthranilate synthase component 1
MTQVEFDLYAQQGYNRIPVAREILADLDTPLSTYLKLADTGYSYLFESVHGGEKWGRYSIIGLPCETIIRVTGQQIVTSHRGKVIDQAISDDPLSWIENYKNQYKVPIISNLPRFNGGLVGYFGYDTVRYIEPRLGDSPNPDPLECPDILLMVSNDLIVFDNLSGRLFLIVHADPEKPNAYDTAQQNLDDLTSRLRTATPNKQVISARQLMKKILFPGLLMMALLRLSKKQNNTLQMAISCKSFFHSDFLCPFQLKQ